MNGKRVKGFGALVALGAVLFLMNTVPDKPITWVNWLVGVLFFLVLGYLSIVSDEEHREEVRRAVHGDRKRDDEDDL
jgi:uncharacterized protein YacL